MKLTAKSKALIEHYLIATGVAAVAIWRSGDHNLHHVVWAAAVGVLAPVVKSAIEHFKAPSN
jgi:hypothetical protein